MVRDYILRKAKKETTIPNIKLWGIPAIITQYGIKYEELDQMDVKDQLKIYIGSSGLVTRDQSNQFNTVTFKKPSSVLLKVNKMIIKHFSEIWKERNLFYASVAAD